MKHHIILKFADGADVPSLEAPVRAIFEETLAIDGIRGIDIKLSNSDRSNRYDMMIIMDMDQEALPAYDVSEPHLRWKAEYGPITASKAIFDCE